MDNFQRNSISVLIVDDEYLGRQRLQQLLKDEPDVVVVKECANGIDAVNAISSMTVDLVFLDVQMPALSGFDVVERVGPDAMPHVIFVTAFDQYALKAFDANAIDYLLKPFDKPRLNRALDKARERVRGKSLRKWHANLGALMTSHPELKSEMEYPDRMIVKSGSGAVFVDIQNIEWIEAAGNYVTLHVGDQKLLHRSTMSELETSLNPAVFVRIHRSRIVNRDRIARIESNAGSEYVITLIGGDSLKTSRSYRPNVLKLSGRLP